MLLMIFQPMTLLNQSFKLYNFFQTKKNANISLVSGIRKFFTRQRTDGRTEAVANGPPRPAMDMSLIIIMVDAL